MSSSSYGSGTLRNLIFSTKARNRTNKSLGFKKQLASSASKSWSIGAMISSLPKLEKVVMYILGRGSTLGRLGTYPTSCPSGLCRYAVPHNPLHVIQSGANHRELERPEGPRKWVSLSIRMLIMMRGRRRSSAEDEVGQAQLYLVRKHHMFYTIIQVRGEGGGVQQGRNEDQYWST